jgi:hypothetical protein
MNNYKKKSANPYASFFAREHRKKMRLEINDLKKKVIELENELRIARECAYHIIGDTK